MLSTPLISPLPTCQKNDMSYTFGPHTTTQKDGVLFLGDMRIGRTPSDKIPIETGSPPAWLVADWMLAVHRGEPISEYATSVLNDSDSWNTALKWLHDFLIL